MFVAKIRHSDTIYKSYEHNYQDTIIDTRHTDYLTEYGLQQQVTGTDDDWSVHTALRSEHSYL